MEGNVSPQWLSATSVPSLPNIVDAVTFAEPTVSAGVKELGGEVYHASSAELTARLTAEVSRWQKVAKFANIKPEQSTRYIWNGRHGGSRPSFRVAN